MTTARPDAASLAKIIKDSLTILVQGPLSPENIPTVISAIHHYRTEFTGAYIAFSISPTAQQSDQQLAEIAAELSQVVDAVTIAQRCPAQPPIKYGIGANHFNQQLASAQAGLKLVTTKYTLRIRSDMHSVQKHIIDHYTQNVDVPRGKYALLRQRVLISPYFTLNPFTTEKLSFHYSDWLHLGLTQDLIQIWSASPYPDVDTDFYPAYPSINEELEEAAKFRSRLAVEQHLYFSLLVAKYPELKLASHTDNRSIQASIHALADNFIIDEVSNSNAIPNKYAALLDDKDIDITCFTHEDWKNITASTPATELKILFEKKIHAANMQRKRAMAGASRASGPSAALTIKAIILTTKLLSGPKSRKKLSESPGLFFYDIKKYPAKAMAWLYFKLTTYKPHPDFDRNV